MKLFPGPVAVAAILTVGAAAGAQTTAIREVPFTQVRITGGFWAQRQAINRESTVWANFRKCEETGRIENFNLAAARNRGEAVEPEAFQGYYFNDSDVYKAIEGASYILATGPDAEVEEVLDGWIERIGAAQQPDGYLNTYYTVKEGLDKRFTNLKDMHELYCAGHLIEAGIAHEQATGKRTLLDIAIRFADLIDATFGPDKRRDVCGHPEIELALIRLSRATGQERYFKLAEFFLEERGRTQPGGRALYGEYCQDQAPIREHEQALGHAVRAMYLYSAVADAAAATGDRAYIEAMDRVWDDLTLKKMYITGGIGSNPATEGFGAAYDLPNRSAYAETCAGIGLAMWAHRLNMLHGDAKYADVLERVLYNGIASGVSLSGDRFFYDNPLESDGSRERPDWYACACCPPNILRFIASLGSYIYAQSHDALYVNLFIDSEAEVTFDGRKVRVSMRTNYPWEGNARIMIRPETPVSFRLRIRAPGWCKEPAVTLPGHSVPPLYARGYMGLAKGWTGNMLTVDLPMPIRRDRAAPEVEADRGRIALARGPIVYALEGADHDADARRIALPPGADLRAEFRPATLGGAMILRGAGLTPDSAGAKAVEITAVPYALWANGDKGSMAVWLPESPDLIAQPPDPSITATASHCWGTDTVTALYDGRVPGDPGDTRVERFTWWPRQGSTEWAQLNFANPRRIRSVQVYWFSDAGGGGGCAAPAAWRLLYKDGEAWKPVAGASGFGTELDRFNTVTFDTVETTGLRLEADLADSKSAGILEWKVK